MEKIQCQYCMEWKDQSAFNVTRSRRRCIKCLKAYYAKAHLARYQTKRAENYGKWREERARRVSPFSEVERAYAAGFMDGEGCVCIYATFFKTSALTVKISNTNLPSLKWIHKRWGGHIAPVKRRERRQVGYQFSLAANQALRFLDDILPYLIIKRKQAKLGIRFQRYVIARGFRSRTEKARNLKMRFVAELHQLNARGQKAVDLAGQT